MLSCGARVGSLGVVWERRWQRSLVSAKSKEPHLPNLGEGKTSSARTIPSVCHAKPCNAIVREGKWHAVFRSSGRIVYTRSIKLHKTPVVCVEPTSCRRRWLESTGTVSTKACGGPPFAEMRVVLCIGNLNETCEAGSLQVRDPCEVSSGRLGKCPRLGVDALQGVLKRLPLCRCI